MISCRHLCPKTIREHGMPSGVYNGAQQAAYEPIQYQALLAAQVGFKCLISMSRVHYCIP